MSVFFLVLIHQIPEALNDLIICKMSEFLILCRWFRRDRHKIRILFPVVILYIHQENLHIITNSPVWYRGVWPLYRIL